MSMLFSCGLKLLQTSKDYLSADVIDKQISAIYEGIKSIYSDVSEASIKAAESALHSENKNKNLTVCVEICIPHLVAAYTISKKALERKKTNKILFVFTHEVDLIDDSEKPTYLSYLALLSGEISILYRYIKQYSNYNKWYDVAIADYTKSLKQYFSNLENIKSINSSYVHEWTEHDIDETDALIAAHSDTSPVVTTTHRIELTDAGDMYVKKEIAKRMNEFKNTLK